MAYASSGAVARGDLNGVVVEAWGAEKNIIGAKIMPSVESPVKAGQYPKFLKSLGETLAVNANPRGPGGSYSRITRAYEFDTYATIDRGIEVAIDDVDERDLSRFFDLESFEAKMLLRTVMLAHEQRVQALIQNTGNFDSTTSSTPYTTENLATFDIGLDVSVAKAVLINRGETGPGKLTLVLSSNVYERVRSSAKLQARIHGYVSGGTLPFVDLTEAQVANALSVDQILVGRSTVQTSGKGQSTFAGAQIWNDTYMWLGYVADGDYFNGGVARTIVWNEEGGLWVTESYREESKRSEILRVRQNTAEKLINAAAGTLIVTQYS